MQEQGVNVLKKCNILSFVLFGGRVTEWLGDGCGLGVIRGCKYIYVYFYWNQDVLNLFS